MMTAFVHMHARLRTRACVYVWRGGAHHKGGWDGGAGTIKQGGGRH